jgi:hypothetical protein
LTYEILTMANTHFWEVISVIFINGWNLFWNLPLSDVKEIHSRHLATLDSFHVKKSVIIVAWCDVDICTDVMTMDVLPLSLYCPYLIKLKSIITTITQSFFFANKFRSLGLRTCSFLKLLKQYQSYWTI